MTESNNLPSGRTRIDSLEMRGGDYFFLPSMTALCMIGMGTVDPT